MADYKAELRVQVDDSTTGDIYQQAYTINENERSQTDCKTFTLSASAERDLSYLNWTSISDLALISNTTSQVTLTVGGSSLQVPFLEHFSIQGSTITDAVVKNTSSVTGTYKVFSAGT